MIQYLINTSVTWLSFILLFELLLKNRSHYQLNRMYLNIGVIAGVIIPLINLNTIRAASKPVFADPQGPLSVIQKSIRVSPVATTSIAQEQAHNYLPQLLWLIYAVGVLIGMIYLVREALQLFKLSRSGRRTFYGKYTIVETGGKQAPFSFFNIIFVSDIKTYSTEEWQMILQHEKEHSRRLHSLDNLLVLMVRIIFWFNPLPYILHKKVREVHEFQADEAVKGCKKEYGNFLLEQNMLSAYSLLTHSFNYSPIKKRLTMLMTKESRKGLFRYVTAVPMIGLLLLVCTKVTFSGESDSKDDVITFNGNTVKFAALKVIPDEYRATLNSQKSMYLYNSLPDSVPIKDAGTGMTNMHKVRTDMMPVSLNGKPIFGKEQYYLIPDKDTSYSTPVILSSANNIEEFLFSALKTSLSKLDDGLYRFDIKRLVVDEKGEPAYYELKGIYQNIDPLVGESTLKNEIKRKIDSEIAALLKDKLKFKPAVKDGQPVNVRMMMNRNYVIKVKQNKAELINDFGC